MYLVSILYKSIAGPNRPVRVADGPITARYRFIKNASWVVTIKGFANAILLCKAPANKRLSERCRKHAEYVWLTLGAVHYVDLT